MKSAIFVSGPVNNASVPGDLYCSSVQFFGWPRWCTVHRKTKTCKAVKLET